MPKIEKHIFEDVGAFRAVKVSNGYKALSKPAYRIFNSEGRYVAFLDKYGSLFVKSPNPDYEGLALLCTDRYFNSRTELKQAVRCAYLMTQKPI